MEQALVLIMLQSSYPTALPEMLKKITGISDANFIYGPYDLYAIVETETKEKMRDIIVQIRNMDGVKSTLTCNVMPT